VTTQHSKALFCETRAR